MFFAMFQRIFPRYFFLKMTFVIFSFFSLPSLSHASIAVSAYDTLGNVKVAQITITNGMVMGVRYY